MSIAPTLVDLLPCGLVDFLKTISLFDIVAALLHFYLRSRVLWHIEFFMRGVSLET